MNRSRISLFLLVFPLLALFLSCTARIDGMLSEDGAVELELNTSLEPRTAALIRSLRSFMGDTQNAPILDAQSISRSMSLSPGVKTTALKNTSPIALEGTISILNAGDFLSASGDKTRLISYKQSPSAGNSSIIFTLDRNSAPDLISRLSPEVEEYLSALMAPAILGEPSSSQEYLSLLSSIYGRPLANEISAARIKANIDFPRPVTAAQGGSISGKRVEFDVPLLDILVLEKPLRYEVSW